MLGLHMKRQDLAPVVIVREENTSKNKAVKSNRPLLRMCVQEKKVHTLQQLSDDN